VQKNRDEKANMMEPFEGNEEERERRWSERELGGSIHGGAAGTERLCATYASKKLTHM
jgi:hypothetical protein